MIIGGLFTIISVFIGLTFKAAIKKMDEIKTDGDRRGERFDVKIDNVQRNVDGSMAKLGELSERVTALSTERKNDRDNLSRLESNFMHFQAQLSNISARVEQLGQMETIKKLAKEAGIEL